MITLVVAGPTALVAGPLTSGASVAIPVGGPDGSV